MRACFALFQSNLRLTLRDRAALFFNYVFPLLFFFLFAGLFTAPGGLGVSFLVGMALTLGILGNGLWGAGMRSVQDREANILRRFKVAPITPLPILLSAMAAGWLLYLPVAALLIGLAHFLYGMPLPRQWFSLFLLISLGLCAFRAIGLILAAVVNTAQEATILIQLFYLPMLLLSGATIPAAMLPGWLQTLASFLPATYLVNGLQGIFFRNQSILNHGAAAAALLVTLALGLFLANKLFRWEKEEKISARSKLWVAAALAPFLLIGGFRAVTNRQSGWNAALLRILQRSQPLLIRNARLFTATGRIVETGSVLVRQGKIAEIYQGAGPDPASLKADVMEAAGKTLLPGLIDVHVHLSGLGGVSTDEDDYRPEASMPRAAAAFLYTGVTAVRSLGDDIRNSLQLRSRIANGAILGPELFITGPVFTARSGSGAEFFDILPKDLRNPLKAGVLRSPKTPEEARREVRALKSQGVDGLKAVLEAGWGDQLLADRMDLLLARSIAEEGRARGLALATHTGDSVDVADAVEIGSASVEHGSWRDELPDSLLAAMRAKGVYYDPTLSCAEEWSYYFSKNSYPLSEVMVRRTALARVLDGTQQLLRSGKAADAARAAAFRQAFETARSNLLRAWQAGVPLVMGTDAGSPLVYPGPSLHHELRLWVQSGIPPEAALQAATANAARLLRAANRIGSIQKGLQANLLLVNGNPLQDISATERIAAVIYKGKVIDREDLIEDAR